MIKSQILYIWASWEQQLLWTPDPTDQESLKKYVEMCN